MVQQVETASGHVNVNNSWQGEELGEPEGLLLHVEESQLVLLSHLGRPPSFERQWPQQAVGDQHLPSECMLLLLLVDSELNKM